MTKIPKSAALENYPRLWRWVTEYGTLEIGHCHRTRSFIRVRIINPDGTGSYKHLFGRVRFFAFGRWRSMSTSFRAAAENHSRTPGQTA